MGSVTKKINSVFLYVAQMMRDIAKIKMGESRLLFDIPHLVEPMGQLSNFDPEDLIKIFEFLEAIESDEI